jgi:hypothetical protein
VRRSSPPKKIIPRHGLIVWLEDCPNLDNSTGKQKKRPILVVEPNADPQGESIVVCCSETAGPGEPDSVELPNLSDDPRASTGLPSPCCAIPRWFLPIPNTALATCEYGGTLGGRKLKQVLMAYIARRDAV